MIKFFSRQIFTTLLPLPTMFTYYRGGVYLPYKPWKSHILLQPIWYPRVVKRGFWIFYSTRPLFNRYLGCIFRLSAYRFSNAPELRKSRRRDIMYHRRRRFNNCVHIHSKPLTVFLESLMVTTYGRYKMNRSRKKWKKLDLRLPYR